MSDDPTNLQIANLLKRQTYDERLEMAKWLENIIRDYADEHQPDKPNDDLIAFWLGSWAEAEIDSYEPAE